MNSGDPDSIGKSLRMISATRGMNKNSVADTPWSYPTGPQSPPVQHPADATETQESNPNVSTQQASSSETAASRPSEFTEGAAVPKKNHLLIPIPSRRSSKTGKQTPSERAEEAAPGTPSRRESRVSMLKVRRDRSRASSRRSQRAQDVANVEKTQETTIPSTPEMNSPSKPQQKKGSKLLSFLSCCSSPDTDGDDATLPARKTAHRPPASNRLPNPDKAEAHTGDSSTAESRDPAYFPDEKAHMTVNADQSQPQEEEHISTLVDAQGEGTSAGASQPAVLLVSAKEHEDSGVMANGAIPESKTDESQRSDEQTVVTEAVATGSTSKKPEAGGSVNPSHEEDVVQTPAVLPPPPPPPAPEIPPASEVGEQRWLLPPPLPHLQNRKCLVLDLDETLVHSSFKVSRKDFRDRGTCRLTVVIGP